MHMTFLVIQTSFEKRLYWTIDTEMKIIDGSVWGSQLILKLMLTKKNTIEFLESMLEQLFIVSNELVKRQRWT